MLRALIRLSMCVATLAAASPPAGAQSAPADPDAQHKADLIVAYRILVNEGILDSFGQRSLIRFSNVQSSASLPASGRYTPGLKNTALQSASAACVLNGKRSACGVFARLSGFSVRRYANMSSASSRVTCVKLG